MKKYSIDDLSKSIIKSKEPDKQPNLIAVAACVDEDGEAFHSGLLIGVDGDYYLFHSGGGDVELEQLPIDDVYFLKELTILDSSETLSLCKSSA